MGGGGQKSANDDASVGKATKSKNPKTDAMKQERVATVGETLSFAFETKDCNTKLLFAVGIVGGIGNGLIYPFIAYFFSHSLSDIGAAAFNGMDPIKRFAFWFMGIGVYALLVATLQTASFEIVAYRASENMRLQWFHALLRQDQAFFDIYDIGGLANSVNPAANRYRRGVGRKFGEGIQFFTTGIGGMAYALYEEWRVALVVLSLCPLITIFAMGVVQINQTKSARSSAAYASAGSVAYSTVSGIQTVLSLNAAPAMIVKYKEATAEAFRIATEPLIKQGFVNGMMMGSFMSLYVVLTLYGTYNIYKDVMKTGCDPSGSVLDNETCRSSGPNVFGAMLGIAFAGQGISQVGTFLETFTGARVAAGEAMTAIERKPGQPEEKIYHIEEENNDDDDRSVVSSRQSSDYMIETPEGRIKAILPAYEIDSMSTEGLKPESVKGQLNFESVEFYYPTRPGQTVLKDLSIDIPAGKTIAFVGPSGGGKSTVVKLLERFYDPIAGSVKLDGTNVKEINVKHLRSIMGYVGQEPGLFATTIGKNIAYGCPGCSQEQIEEAAKQANAHNFIKQLPDGYDTHVGDKGSQLSGGQKQRIAIARVLVGDPKILVLDEATSALDTESELVVQEALENIISATKRTTVIIAHRLSTIRNADIIAVVMGGTIVETGTHDELINSESYYKKLVDAQSQTAASKRKSSVVELDAHGETESQRGFMNIPDQLVDKDATPMLTFCNVSFSYPTRPGKTVLDRFKLKIYKGETIGLCGISGGGKSTVMGLIERFYDPCEGSLEYYGENLRDLNVKWYRDQIGYVGQEPTLFDATIAENIAFGAPGLTRDKIIEAAKQANAYDFIMKFPEDFDTPLSGGSGTELSGGQKQRVAIARALAKDPQILLLDEATSALDNESERIVQEALDKLMKSKERTCIVIAHRLSTIRNASRIAFIGNGRVKEIGTHDELMEKPNGKYKRLVESQGRTASTLMLGLEGEASSKKKKKKVKDHDEENEDETQEDFETQIEKEELSSFSFARACKLASPEALYLLFGSLGALMVGSIYPTWGILFAETIELLFRRIPNCTPDILELAGFLSCEDFWDDEAIFLKEESYTLSLYWTIIIIVCVIGYIILFWGYDHASQGINKRVRDDAFYALVRQEVSYFDKRSVGKITSGLQEDTAQVQVFISEPIKQILIALSSIVVGIVISLYYMWPFALLSIACVPVLGFASMVEMKAFLGEDEGDANATQEANSPGGIVVETLLNMSTVSALTMEEERYRVFEDALKNSDENYVRQGLHEGFLGGFSMFAQQWINALQFWFGGWLLFNNPDKYTFSDFLISNFAILFGLFSLGVAFQDVSDRKEVEKSISRVFYLLDKQSEIDPLSEAGKEIDYDKISMMKKRKSEKKIKKKEKHASSLKNVAEDDEHVREVVDKDLKIRSSSLKKKKSKRSSKKLLDKNNDDEPKKPRSSKKRKSKKTPKEEIAVLPEEEVEGHFVFEDSNRSGVPNEEIEIAFQQNDEVEPDDEESEVRLSFRYDGSEEEPPADIGALIANLEEKAGPDGVVPVPTDMNDVF
eukprot:CAMPEP_0197184268 /NCGR_PEP_ID=MMETSP1423-20130617/9534_1 /TAXON_ID=476441 /ORGANISM="Pseudo-nitzschia heimii, Strain UNC1101" /LENGTH=1555 /DNA_ID=CAMNT_0042635045 /DNA_START=48 /DNA_END=4715 /DNA_ORIENTATION=-